MVLNKMKTTKLRLKRKEKLTGVRKVTQEINEIVKACLDDIRPYLVNDLKKYLKKQGIIYAKKSKKNRKEKKTKR